MNKLREVREVLDEINSALVAYDPVLKEQARDLLLRTAFGAGATGEAPVAVQSGEEAPQPATAPARVDAEPQGEEAAPTRRRRRRRLKDATLGDLLTLWRPSKASERALLGAYYVARYTDDKYVTSHAVNAALKEYDLQVANITRAIETCLNSTPALMAQVEKRGTTRQARKLYRITSAGVSVVEERLYAQDD